jgi:glycosyltransferase involved in cell wall biosynthesis
VPYTILEVISGLGMGGAEKSFLSRLDYAPAEFETFVINTRPELDSWKLPTGAGSVNCSRKSFSFFSHLYKVLGKLSPDIVIARSPIDFLAISLMKFIYRKEWKLVYEAHSIVISQNLLISLALVPFMRLAISKADLVIAVSKSVANGQQCRGAKSLVLFHVGANAKVSNVVNRNFTFLFVGRFIPLKQPLLFLEAIRLSAEAFLFYRAKVKFIGKGSLEPEISAFIEANQLGDIVELCGYHKDLDSVYSASEYLVSTSRFEGLPITFFEAKLHGLRILTTPSSGDFDILSSEDSVLKDFTVESLVGALKDALAEGQISGERRLFVQEQNAWMQSRERSKLYYELIRDELTKPLQI